MNSCIRPWIIAEVSELYILQKTSQTNVPGKQISTLWQACFLLGRANIFFFAWPKRKKGFIGSGGYNFFQGMIFKSLQTVPPQNSGHHFITFFEGHLSFKNSPLWVDVNYLSAQYLKNHFMKHFPTLWLLLRKFLGAQLHLSVVISVFEAHHLGAMWIICLHNILRTTWWNIFLFSGCFFGSFLGCSHWKHTPGFDHGLKLPKCGSRISNSLGRLTWRWESWNRLLNHSLKEFKKISHLLNSFYDPMPNTCLYFFYNHFIVDKHFQCTAVQYTECWYTFKTELKFRDFPLTMVSQRTPGV